MLDSTPFPVAVVDKYDDKVEFWSKSAKDLLGHTAPTAAEWYEIAYPDEDYRRDVIERWKPMLEKARSSGAAVNTGEYNVTCHDGSVRVCELYAGFVNENLIVTFNDITERKRLEEVLGEREAMLSRLAGRLQSLREDERVAVARELHDELGAGLTGMKMDLDWVVAKAADVDRELFEHAQSAATLTESSMELVHRICQRLRPPVLDILGLPSAISWYVGEFEKETGIASHATGDELDLDLESDAAVAVFRILQESLTNVVRHSRADRVEVELGSSKESVELSVTDNGVGISEHQMERKCC